MNNQLLRRKDIYPKVRVEYARKNRKHPTPAEAALWQHLRRKQLLGATFVRQHAIHTFIPDFVCKRHKLIVEVDGSSHNEKAEQDAKRDDLLERNGYRVLRFTNGQVLQQPAEVVKRIKKAIYERLREGY